MIKTENWGHFKRIFSLLPKTQKRSFILFILFGSFTSIVQSFGVVSILPFVSAIADYESLRQNPWIDWLYTTFNFSSSTNFIIFLAVIFVIFLVLSNVFLLISTFIKLKIVKGLDETLSHKLFSAYLYYDYEFLLNLESNELAKNVLNETQNFTHRFIMAFFEIVIHALMSFSIIVLLLIVDPITSILMIVVFVLFYGMINSFLRKKIKSYGKNRNRATQNRFKRVDETLKNIKLVKIHHLEEHFIKQFDHETDQINSNQMMMGLMQQSPYYLMDLVLIISLFMIVFIYDLQGSTFVEFVPKLSFFALAAYRLKPFVNKLYHGIVDLTFYQDSAEKLIEIMEDYRSPKVYESNKLILKSIELNDISFSYLNSHHHQLKSVNVKLNQNQIIGLTGKTGSGKTTLIHILMGLLKMDTGVIKINDQIVNENLLYNCQSKMAYVPQEVSLMDTSIRRNIAYGVNEEDIDEHKIKEAAHMACIDEFIDTLEEGYETRVGDNGVKLSGGQRQRIGLARAFYRNPEFLILDEATNSLDHPTETRILNQLHESHPNCMILMITHRIQSLNRCDYIYLLKEGEIVDEGTYEKLASTNHYFISILEDKHD